jgi:hypothetical protein
MTASVFSPGRFRGWIHVRGVEPAALAEAAGVKEAYVLACAYDHSVASSPTGAVLAAWAAQLGCAPADLRSTTPHDPNEYWRGANKAMPRMSEDDLAAVADIFTRTARQAAGDKP